MNELRKINKEIRRTEKKRAETVNRTRYYWKRLDALYEKRRLLMEGEHSSGSRPEEMLSGN